MIISRFLQSRRLALLLLGMLLAFDAAPQVAEEEPLPEPPDLESLQTDWWSFFVGPREEVEPRIDEFFETVKAGNAELAPQTEEIADTLLVAVKENVSAYLALLDEPEHPPLELEPAPIEYSMEDLLQLAHAVREAEASARQERLEVEREQQILAGASRRRDSAFGDYVDADSGDERRLASLRLLQARSAQAISARRLELLTRRYEQADTYATALAARLEVAKQRLATTLETAELDDLIETVQEREAAVRAAEEALREAQLAASGLNAETAEGRSRQRLLQQRMLGAEIGLALAETVLAQAEAVRWWTELQLETGPDIDLLSNRMLGWAESLRLIADRIPEWQRATEDELLAAQGALSQELDRASLRLLDERLGAAQETLVKLDELATESADLELVMTAVEISIADQSGALESLWTNTKINIKAAWLRVATLADVTLFSIGEAPVTGGDILRVLLIMVAALLLSRGIRHTIGSVGRIESSGTQASLYTVGRLTHYVIIIFAVFIALSSVGIDFGNLALVAGALSVGIGFGLQSIVNNFVSGLIILFEHTLRVGDYIELDNGLTGTVKSINVRSTLINTNDNIDVVVPNSEFVTARLQNWTLGERILRVRIPFGVAYGSDKELVKQAALEAAAEVPYTLTHMKGREPDAWLTEFGDNSLNFLLLVWVNRQGARRPTRTRSAYLWALETKLREYGIEIPFPQRDLHLRSGWPAEEAPPPATDPDSAPA